MRLVALGLFALLALGCSDDDSNGGTGGTSTDWTGPGGQGGGGIGTGGDGANGGGGSGASGGASPVDCVPAEGSGSAGTDAWQDGAHSATVSIAERDTCARTYTLGTTAPLRDDQPQNPRVIVEAPGWPVLRSGHDMLDALYALALDEVRELSVSSIQDFAFNGGQPLPCPAGGCFETGRLWNYVWTRDTAYAVQLGLGALDPIRAKNSLSFKLSERRAGGDLQIVQDTGTGGSYPVSTDRVTWALGAWELLKYLDGAERDAFRDMAFEAMVNTAEHDRKVVFDARDGLYRGEQSFLDWREQSYPGWVATDTVQIGMSKSLSTNVAHHALLEVTAALADEKGLTPERDQYRGWADQLAGAIDTALWQNGDGLYATYLTTELDPAPVHRFDLLGSALVATSSITDDARARTIVASYPHLPKGPSVIWPQQKDIPIYHNRGIWPFVTALWLRAGKRAENAPAIAHGVRSLIRGAALNLSNMENFEAATGASWLDDGSFSGPVVNSQRQLWSVAGFVSMVHDVIFGLEATQTGLRFAPFIPADLRESIFAGADRIALSGFAYKEKRLTVVLVLGDAGGQAALAPQSVTVDGDDVGLGVIPATALGDGSVIEVTLGPAASSEGITEVAEADIADYRNLFGPSTPAVTGVSEAGGLLTIGISAAGESTADITFDVYRDGALVASSLPGTTTSWTDTQSGGQTTESYCYTVEARFTSSGNRSQHAKPFCWWGAANARIASVGAQSFSAVGGNLVDNYGHWHYEGWGDPGHSLTLAYTPTFTGTHYLQLLAGNGAGNFTTGITCAVKRVQIFDGNTLVAESYVMMPHLATWDAWRESSLMHADLEAGKTYSVVISEDAAAVNMSERAHFEIYGGTGGQSGRFNRVNIAEVKFLATSIE